jgi:hypothetical protein
MLNLIWQAIKVILAQWLKLEVLAILSGLWILIVLLLLIVITKF